MAAVRLLLFMALTAHAEEAFKAQVNHYRDTNGIVVTSPYAAGELELDERSKIAVRYTLDAVSGASFNYAASKTHAHDPARAVGTCKTCHNGIDAISGASRTYFDTRHDLNIGVTRRVGETDLKPGYIRSIENDYLSETFSFGVDQNFNARNSTLSLAVRRQSDVIAPTWNKHDVRTLATWDASLGLTQVLSRSGVGKLALDVADAQGFQSNPYAFIQVGALSTLPFAEKHPLEKQRIDLSSSFKQALPFESSLQLDYRFYRDSWALQSHTAELSLAKQIDRFTLECGWRYYTQNAAYFFKNRYQQPEALMTRDLKLAAFDSQLISASLRGALGLGWSTELRYSRLLRQDRLDYSRYFADGPVSADIVVLAFTLQ